MPSSDRCRASRGFTLIELVVVLAILGLVMVLAVPAADRFMPGAELRAAARTVAAVLREARAHAIRDNREVPAVVNLDSRIIWIEPAGRPAQLGRRLGIALYTATSELVDEGTGRIRFFADGTSTGGRVSLSNDGREYHVLVDWLTGRVRIADSIDG
jgi:general secretion pathway protein H